MKRTAGLKEEAVSAAVRRRRSREENRSKRWKCVRVQCGRDGRGAAGGRCPKKELDETDDVNGRLMNETFGQCPCVATGYKYSDGSAQFISKCIHLEFSCTFKHISKVLGCFFFPPF